ncbi:hypothetical protein EEB15_29960 [Ramlibacter sp. WS9]|nr:hypothetical protein EEB15_29960 [Ramlibacter sp. WS9]
MNIKGLTRARSIRAVAAALALGLCIAGASAQPLEEALRRAEVFHIMLKDRELAEKLSAELGAAPSASRLDKFKRLARQHSADPGSSKSGGDLGLVWEGEMALAFEDAVFAATPGVVGPPVETPFGWHLIYVRAFRHEQGRSFCQKSMAAAIKSAKPAEREWLAGPSQLTDRDPVQAAVTQRLGKYWSEPTNGKKDELVYFSTLPREIEPERKTLEVHVEVFAAPWRKVSPATGACTRSRREEWLLDCENQKIGNVSMTHYEGRAGDGRIVQHAQFGEKPPYRDVAMWVPAHGTLGDVALGHGCTTSPQIVLPPLGIGEKGPTEDVFFPDGPRKKKR